MKVGVTVTAAAGAFVKLRIGVVAAGLAEEEEADELEEEAEEEELEEEEAEEEAEDEEEEEDAVPVVVLVYMKMGDNFTSQNDKTYRGQGSRGGC